mgnify:CR=1 FL=1
MVRHRPARLSSSLVSLTNDADQEAHDNEARSVTDSDRSDEDHDATVDHEAGLR